MGHRRILADPEVVTEAVEFIRAEQPVTVPDAGQSADVPDVEQRLTVPGAGQSADVPDGRVARPRPGSALL